MIGVGDWVVCVDASDDPRGYPVPLIKGEVYQVEAIWSDLPNCKIGDFWRDTGFDLFGVPALPGAICYGAFRFREIDKPSVPAKILEAAR